MLQPLSALTLLWSPSVTPHTATPTHTHTLRQSVAQIAGTLQRASPALVSRFYLRHFCFTSLLHWARLRPAGVQGFPVHCPGCRVLLTCHRAREPPLVRRRLWWRACLLRSQLRPDKKLHMWSLGAKRSMGRTLTDLHLSHPELCQRLLDTRFSTCCLSLFRFPEPGMYCCFCTFLLESVWVCVVHSPTSSCCSSWKFCLLKK